MVSKTKHDETLALALAWETLKNKGFRLPKHFDRKKPQHVKGDTDESCVESQRAEVVKTLRKGYVLTYAIQKNDIHSRVSSREFTHVLDFLGGHYEGEYRYSRAKFHELTLTRKSAGTGSRKIIEFTENLDKESDKEAFEYIKIKLYDRLTDISSVKGYLEQMKDYSSDREIRINKKWYPIHIYGKTDGKTDGETDISSVLNGNFYIIFDLGIGVINFATKREQEQMNHLGALWSEIVTGHHIRCCPHGKDPRHSNPEKALERRVKEAVHIDELKKIAEQRGLTVYKNPYPGFDDIPAEVILGHRQVNTKFQVRSILAGAKEYDGAIGLLNDRVSDLVFSAGFGEQKTRDFLDSRTYKSLPNWYQIGK